MEIDWIIRTSGFRQQKLNSKFQVKGPLVGQGQQGTVLTAVICVAQVPPLTLPCPDLSRKAWAQAQSTSSLCTWVQWAELAGDCGRGGEERGWGTSSTCLTGLWKRLHFSKATKPAHGPSPQATALPASRKVASSLVTQKVPGTDFPLFLVPRELRGPPSPACISEDNSRQSLVQLLTLSVPYAPTWTLPDSGVSTALQEAGGISFRYSRNQVISHPWVPFTPALTFFSPTVDWLLQVSGNMGSTAPEPLMREPGHWKMTPTGRISEKDPDWIVLSQVNMYR